MTYPIDNFEIVENNILQFDNVGEFYTVLVLKRKKDKNEEEAHFGVKHFFLYMKSDLNKIEGEIKSLCDLNTARAYILPQRRSTRLVLWSLHDNISDLLKKQNFDFKMNHLIRTSVAGMHNTENKSHKRWVLDIDANDEVTFLRACKWREVHSNPTSDAFVVREYVSWIVYKLRLALVNNFCVRTEDVEDFMPKPGAYKEDDIFFVPTPHGFHIVTPPFNRDMDAISKYFGIGHPLAEWIKPDAMALLYAPAF